MVEAELEQLRDLDAIEPVQCAARIAFLEGLRAKLLHHHENTTSTATRPRLLMTDAELLTRIGQALFGERHWQAGLAAVLGVAHRSVGRWSLGTLEPPARIWAELLAIAEGRHQELAAVIEELKRRQTS